MMELGDQKMEKTLPVIPEGVEPVIRIKAPTTGTIEFEDGVKVL